MLYIKQKNRHNEIGIFRRVKSVSNSQKKTQKGYERINYNINKI